DKAEQKGTGRWTSQSALDLGVPIPTISAAVNARIISSFKSQRTVLSGKLKDPEGVENRINKEKFLSRLKDACYTGMLFSYVQGMHLLAIASEEFDYGLNLSEIARIWKGGCIIRARLLDTIKNIYQIYPVAVQAKKWGIPTPAMSTCLDYYDSYRAATLPANLIQAQRDFFGAHRYERVDKEGTFHTMWQKDKAG
ncbi:MAG: NADP-dependent phosphogluconate dehydrogenase, partial [Deltaproteobacteria bacterium]|nr:NADP-dependent phosphogluconate dehydrogenase [Deltaproteobacteria bacterium]